MHDMASDDAEINAIEQTVLRCFPALADELHALTAGSGKGSWHEEGVEVSYKCVDPDARHFVFGIVTKRQPELREFPATLVDTPCVVELMQTHDHGDYFKCGDVGQMLIVHESEEEQDALDTTLAEHYARVKGTLPPGARFTYPSGLAPPNADIVEGNFAAVHTRNAADFTKAEVRATEDVLERSRRKDGGGKKRVVADGGGGGGKQKNEWCWREVQEEVVDFEPWMLQDKSDLNSGKTVLSTDDLVKEHPEIMTYHGKKAPEKKSTGIRITGGKPIGGKAGGAGGAAGGAGGVGGASGAGGGGLKITFKSGAKSGVPPPAPPGGGGGGGDMLAQRQAGRR